VSAKARPGTAKAPTRVLVCEDSRTYAAALSRTLAHDGDIQIVGISPTAEDAIARLTETAPDLVTMDIELPGMSGLEAVEQIMSVRPVPILVLSSHVGHGSTAGSALAAGALDALAKDDLDLHDPGGPAAGVLRQRVRLLSRARVIRHPRARLANGRRPAASSVREASVVAICASTGGPQALSALFAALPASFPIPILVVQHITAGFIEGFARWLDSAVRLPVAMASEGQRATPGIWIAPDGAHLLLGRYGRLALDRETVSGPHRPSGDALFASVAEQAGAHGAAVVLTGMGRDGAEGLAAVRRVGGFTIAQDEKTSAVFGMPRAAAQEQPDLVLPLDRIPRALAALKVPKKAA